MITLKNEDSVSCLHEDVCCFAASRGKHLNEEKKKNVCNDTSAICPDCVCVLIPHLIASPREGRELSTPHSSRKLSLQSAGSRMSQSNCAPDGSVVGEKRNSSVDF